MEPKALGESISASYEAWFKQLQALTSDDLSAADWTGRWYDNYTPAEALLEGPDEDRE